MNIKKIEQRNIRILVNSGLYFGLRRVSLVSALSLFFGYIALGFKSESVISAPPEDSIVLCSIMFFILYKWANDKIQHIETIRYYEEKVNMLKKDI